MFFKYSNEFDYCIDYLVTKIGLKALNKGLLDHMHAILADYYLHLEDSSNTSTQICWHKLAVIDTILDAIKVSRIFTKRVEAAKKIFTKYEAETDINFFINWLKNNPDSNNYTHQALKFWLKNTADEILENINSSDKTSWTFNFGELEEIFKPIIERCHK